MIRKYFFLILYRFFARFLPLSGNSIFARKLRYICAKNIFQFCGHGVNLEKGAFFSRGFNIQIGNFSGIGHNCFVPDDVKIGDNVLMGPNVYIFGNSTHRFESIDIPIRLQGRTKSKPVVIEDDVWIGRNVIINHGRHISKGTIIAAGSVVTRDFPPFSIIGGNPAVLIRKR